MSAPSTTSSLQSGFVMRKLDLQVFVLVCPDHSKCSLSLAMEGDIGCLTKDQRQACAAKLTISELPKASREALECLDGAFELLKRDDFDAIDQQKKQSLQTRLTNLESQLCSFHKPSTRSAALDMLKSREDRWTWSLTMSNAERGQVWNALTANSAPLSCTCPPSASTAATAPNKWDEAQGKSSQELGRTKSRFRGTDKLETLQEELERIMLEIEADKDLKAYATADTEE